MSVELLRRRIPDDANLNIAPVVMSPDGLTCYANMDIYCDVLTWHVDDATKWSIESGLSGVLTLSPDGTMLVAREDHHIFIRHMLTKRTKRYEGVRAIAFSHDGLIWYLGQRSRTIAICTADGISTIVDDVIGYNYNVCSLLLSPDGNSLYANGHDWVNKWNLNDTAAGPTRLPLCRMHFDTFVLSPDGRTLYALDRDHRVCAFDADNPLTPSTPFEIQDSDVRTALFISPDGKTLYSNVENGSGCWVNRWDTESRIRGMPLRGRVIRVTRRLVHVLCGRDVVSYVPRDHMLDHVVRSLRAELAELVVSLM